MSNTSTYVWTPPPELVEQSNLTAFLRATGQPDYDALAIKADADPAWLMEQVFRFCVVRFCRPYDQVLDLSRGLPWTRWCVGGTTNIVLNCIDKHEGTPVWDQAFLVWEGEDVRERRTLTYRDFAHDVGRVAQALVGLGIARGDVVAIYMPNLSETFVAFFAILKIGAIVLPLFSGFGPKPIETRLNHGGAKAVITASGTWRRGTPAPLKAVLDAALEAVPTVRYVIVAARSGLPVDTPMRASRDLWWHDLIDGRGRCASDRRNGCRRPGNPALHLRHDWRAEGMRLDPHRLYRHDGDAGPHNMRRFQAVGSLVPPQRHGLDGRRDVRVHSQFRGWQPADCRGHARLP